MGFVKAWMKYQATKLPATFTASVDKGRWSVFTANEKYYMLNVVWVYCFVLLEDKDYYRTGIQTTKAQQPLDAIWSYATENRISRMDQFWDRIRLVILYEQKSFFSNGRPTHKL